ncbi:MULTISPECIES: inactive transglutaminase family protein [unclassified Lentimonas]|uniref:inactive transglutaminase family protein n=1 Tax=unclassified Lentimonas TaxID=2630993 RepID=UPI001325AA7D|nr:MULTISPECIES: inactive transglutaminase family protein [unclassified Lentimonas]CAA6678014.1 FIG139976: hypothetical protein [Lentimonas sp. CC4]CAA6686988.1 FIG139976: hypothetical protein [Lentimonas sp. CC6]CAA6696770.1 FIG139976: hypothetical protein [Lentimonas sp. CC10]CAA6697268.1 FIG139976: hypothetical protein [Lentimonas sp. CC19]CAA7072290.1 FIG139976: hypothetical protein [Lentimonas sp. CC11]
MNSKVQLRILIFILAAVGIGVMLTKHFQVGYPLIPKQQIPIWTIEAKVTFQATGDPVKVSLAVPGEQARFGILEETGSSHDYGFIPAGNDPKIAGFYRSVIWSKGQATGRQELYYRIDVYQKGRAEDVELHAPEVNPSEKYSEGQLGLAAQELITKAKQHSADAETFAGQLIQMLDNESNQNAQTLIASAPTDLQRAHLLNTLIIFGGYESHFIRALLLAETSTKQALEPMVILFDEDKLYAFVWGNPKPVKIENALAWQRGGPSLIEIEGGNNAKVEFSVVKQSLPASFVLEQASRQRENSITDFSLTSLSIEQQDSYRLLLTIPFGALIVVIMRNIIGIRTTGTFMPILLAMAFLRTDLGPGLILFVIVVSAGLTMRAYLSKLDLLLVPRISAVVVVVIGIMVGFGIVGGKFDLQIMQSVTLFPTIILSWTVERLSVLWEEDGPKEVGIQTLGSLVVAIMAYAAMGNPTLRYLVFVFPELLLVALAVILALGQYSGYRLSELMRFAPMVKDNKEGAA